MEPLWILVGVFLGWLASEKINEVYVMLLKALASRAVNVLVIPEHARVDRNLKEGQPFVEIVMSCLQCGRKEVFRFTEPPKTMANAYQCPHCQSVSPIDLALSKQIAEALTKQKPQA